MEKISTKNGQLERTEIVVFGRKCPLLDLWIKFLAKHVPYMCLQTDKQIDAMPCHAMFLTTIRSTVLQLKNSVPPQSITIIDSLA